MAVRWSVDPSAGPPITRRGNAAANAFIAQARAFFSQQIADPAAAGHLSLQEFQNLRQQQASALAYFDVFSMSAALMLAVLFLVSFMKRSVAEKGSRASGE
jgi:DHA2 family multidrug resistance protein